MRSPMALAITSFEVITLVSDRIYNRSSVLVSPVDRVKKVGLKTEQLECVPW